MKLNKIKKYIIISLVVLEVCVIHLAYKSFNNKEIIIDDVKLKEVAQSNSNGFAIMLNDGTGTYTQSSDSTFPKAGYIYNEEKSGCMDSSGKAIADTLVYDNSTHNVRVRTKQKMSCYLYFDKKDQPVIDKFYINDETSNKTTKVPEVTLHLTWSDPYIKEYCISEIANIDSCTWTPSNGVTEVTSNYTFSSEGSKTFYAYIKDIAEGISEVKSDNITYANTKSGSDVVNNPIPGVVESTGVAQDELAVRYYGTNPANYICFGTNDKNVCTSNQDKYMYRIIGITKETSEHKGGMFKIIKKEALETAYRWHNDDTTDIKWPQSELYTNLNGSTFLTNTAYIPNTTWSNKIETINWKYGDIYNASNVHNATNKTAAQMVQTEQAFTTTISAKIGLMYLADYYYGLNKNGLNCSANSNSIYPTCATSWMHLKQNDTSAPNTLFEWTMSRYGYFTRGGYYYTWYVHTNGYISPNNLDNTYSVRPVFYLKSGTELSGTGTQSDPFMIVN